MNRLESPDGAPRSDSPAAAGRASQWLWRIPGFAIDIAAGIAAAEFGRRVGKAIGQGAAVERG
jgi:hypothetical protein